MTRQVGRVVLAVVLVAAAAGSAAAHPVPFSYVDLQVGAPAIQATVVVHVFDVAHDLQIDAPEQLLDPAYLATRADAIVRLLTPRFALVSDGVERRGTWSAPEPITDRQSLRFTVRYPGTGTPGLLVVRARAFPYDAEHRTFLNIHERGELTAAEVLDRSRLEARHFTGTRQGRLAVMRTFVPTGVEHILIGPDHVLFLLGLLLTGGSIRRLLLVVTAFTLAHSVTLSIAALGWVMPPAWAVEPAIALSIVYVGIDNLIRRDGRDLRAWIAFGFGLVHGFGFASVLREVGVPSRALGWSLLSFNVGVEIGQVAIVAIAASILYAVRVRSTIAARWVVRVGSVVVVAAGAYWFVERTLLAR